MDEGAQLPGDFRVSLRQRGDAIIRPPAAASGARSDTWPVAASLPDALLQFPQQPVGHLGVLLRKLHDPIKGSLVAPDVLL